MKKTLFKALIPTMAMILVAIMALTGTTYAWFTNVQKATVDTIDIQIDAASNMKIATANGAGTATTTWTNTLLLSDLKASGTSKFPTWDSTLNKYKNFKPTSNSGSSTNDFDGKFFTAVNSSASGYIDNGTSDTTNFIKFEVYVWNDSPDTMTVKLRGSTVTADNSCDTALRIALVDLGQITTNINSATVATSSGIQTAKAQIWSPNETVHVASGITNSVVTKALKSSWTGSKTDSASDVTENQNVVTSPENISFSINASGVQKVAIYVWVEGQDVDCINAIAASDFHLALMFDAE